MDCFHHHYLACMRHFDLSLVTSLLLHSYQAWGGSEFHITQQSLTDFIRGGVAPWEETPDSVSAAKHLLHGRHLYNAAHNKRRSEHECRWPVLALVYGALIGCSSGHPSSTWHLKFCNLKCKLKQHSMPFKSGVKRGGRFWAKKRSAFCLTSWSQEAIAQALAQN